ncbi:hypothetical protein [Streptomyces sp. TP-A0356]|uniref:hypothetical protein n=1 Tax=Streptomyces sp. TP-A0356 TaxID=1359208 RepID=UPI0006E30E51
MAPTDETSQIPRQESPLDTTPPDRPPAGGGAVPNARMPRWLPRAMVLALALVKRYDVTDDPRAHGHLGPGSGVLIARLRRLFPG